MVKVKTYSIAAVITLLLLLSGYSMNWYLGDLKEKQLQQQFLDLQTSIVESQLELTYLTEFTEDGCELLEEAKDVTRINLFDVNKRLESLEEISGDEFEARRLKTEQSISYINLWMFARKMKEECKTNLTTILYFWDAYSIESQQQGYVLDTITRENGDVVLIIPLDYNFDLGMIKILSKEFNVTRTPTIIINEKIKLEGIHSKSEILDYVFS